MKKHRESKPPTDLKRPAPKDPRPGNPEIMRALQKAINAR
ncbi:hypothetical protein Ssi03_13430 [Sphaerisporangium siamense]|uniref:Uncharacterized protein n=1 Tax=Sphaerisporangium siamense TaxID=795645 RepID=A0A7W7DCJ7_9ACTN|nr:hypothetical protein [Sphaerisporangium siamense]GII83353.1 hypothetical protein Ssi03_13430 [Sphaerisporangium siamense]